MSDPPDPPHTRRLMATSRTEPVSVLGLSRRPRTRLLAAGIDTIGKLAVTSDEVLMALPAFGLTSLDEVHRRLDDYLARVALTEVGVEASPDPEVPASFDLIRRVATLAFENGITTLGQLVHALDETPTWLDDAEEVLATLIEPLTDATFAPQFGWEAAVDDTLAAASASGRAAVLETSPFRPGGARTLEQVGNDAGVTRERIRQLRVKTCRIMAERSPVAAAARKLGRLLDPGCPESLLVAQGFDPSDHHVQVLLAVATSMDELAGALWSEDIANERWHGTGATPTAWLRESVRRAGVIPVADIDEAFSDHYPHAPVPLLHELLRRSDDLRVMGQVVVDWSGSMLDKAIRVLQVHGSPMTPEELEAAVEPTSSRALANQLGEGRKHGSRLVRTVDKRWALPDWAVDAYIPGVDLMTQIIEEADGKMSLRRLAKEVAARGGFTVSSVHMWATMSPRFVCEDQVVRCRRPDEPIPIPEPEEHPSLVRRVDDPVPGCWSTCLTVDYETIRTTSTVLPLPFAPLLDIGFDQERTIRCDELDVGMSWRMNSLYLHSSAGWRTVCQTLGATDGDCVIFTATGPGTATARLAPPSDGSMAVGVIRSIIGGEGSDDVLTDVAWAVGFDGRIDVDFTLDDLNARLVKRRDHALREALLDIHPELAA